MKPMSELPSIAHLRLTRLCVLLLLPLSSLASAGMISGQVVQVIDGDTLVLETNRQRQTVDLAGIDAPERLQPFGAESKNSLIQLAFNKPAQAECVAARKQGRQTCVVRVQDVDLAQSLLSSGMAWWDRQAGSDQGKDAQGLYQGAEFMAQARRRGLWSEQRPVRPGEWRKRWGLRDE